MSLKLEMFHWILFSLNLSISFVLFYWYLYIVTFFYVLFIISGFSFGLYCCLAVVFK